MQNQSNRREFLKQAGAVSLSILAAPLATAASQPHPEFQREPVDKELSPARIRSLLAKGERKIYRGNELKTIAMPVGGVTAGTVYLTGDGRLAHWDIFNHTPDSSVGNKCYETREPDFPLQQGFSIRATIDGKTSDRTLDSHGFPDVTMVGEYPIGWVTYEDNHFPLRLTLQAFSPFIPLNASDSTLPATILQFKIDNPSNSTVTAELTGLLENAILCNSRSEKTGTRINRVGHDDQSTILECSAEPASLEYAPDFGTMALLCVGQGVGRDATADLSEKLVGSLAQSVELKPQSHATMTFIIAWHFPNRPDRGQFYSNKFKDAGAVARYVATNLDRLQRETQLWHDTYYDSTLPHWFLDRIHMPVGNLATTVTQWWKNGRFWAWEGVGCCTGTCTHVWNYEQALARLFPELERSAREMQDFGAGYHDNGLVGFRGDDEYAADGQAGTVLKAYREHQFSVDDAFLNRNWPKIRKAMEYLIGHDGNDDGWIEDSQPNTYDIAFDGPNTFVGSLYLAALRSAEVMAAHVGDVQFAQRCRHIFESGKARTDQSLFDGEYYFQLVDLNKFPRDQYDHGCLADQLFGQNWASQLGLGYIYSPQHVRDGLRSVYKYDWMPDVGPYNREHPPGRKFADPGESGLIICTFPKSKYLYHGMLYREEVWTGIEYQLASHLFHEGLIGEAMTVVRAVHDRYAAAKRNPWNEVECGDHYSRSLASWGCLTAISGFEYDGPAGRIGFAPRLTPENFRCAFTTAAGWGSFAQNPKSVQLKLKWGSLRLMELKLAIPARRLMLNGRELSARVSSADNRTALSFDQIVLNAGDELSAEFD